MENLKQIVNNSEVSNLFFNLYDRWRDECPYEDINDYAKVIMQQLTKSFPKYNIKLVKPSKKPFGVVINMDDKYTARLYVKLQGRYIKFIADNVRIL